MDDDAPLSTVTAHQTLGVAAAALGGQRSNEDLGLIRRKPSLLKSTRRRC